jgi:hypothetical protein
MFARTANVQAVARQHAARAQVGQTFSKVQEPDRFDATLRGRRPVLLRRWKLDPVSVKPVCAWEVERPDQPRDLGIDPIWPMQEPQLLCTGDASQSGRRPSYEPTCSVHRPENADAPVGSRSSSQ